MIKKLFKLFNKKTILYEMILILIIFFLLFNNFVFAGNSKTITLPETLSEAKELGNKTQQEIKLNFSGIFKKIWEQEILPVFQKTWNFFEKIWSSYIYPFFHKIWINIKNIFIKEFKERKVIIQGEFQKEKKEIKEEIKTDLPEVSKSLWQRFKELIK